MNIVDYFDVNKAAHRKAFKHLEENGVWPKEFWDEAQTAGIDNTFSPCQYDHCWHVTLQAKLLNFYRDFHDNDDVLAIMEAGRIALNSVEQLNLGFQMDLSKKELERLRDQAEWYLT